MTKKFIIKELWLLDDNGNKKAKLTSLKEDVIPSLVVKENISGGFGGEKMNGVRFIHCKNTERIYTAYKVNHNDNILYIILWDEEGYKGQSVTYKENEVDKNFEKGIWIKLVD